MWFRLALNLLSTWNFTIAHDWREFLKNTGLLTAPPFLFLEEPKQLLLVLPLAVSHVEIPGTKLVGMKYRVHGLFFRKMTNKRTGEASPEVRGLPKGPMFSHLYCHRCGSSHWTVRSVLNHVSPGL